MDRKAYIKSMLAGGIGIMGLAGTVGNAFAMGSKGRFEYEQGGSKKVVFDAADIKQINEVLGIEDGAGGAGGGSSVASLIERVENMEAFLATTDFIASHGVSTDTTLNAFNVHYLMDADKNGSPEWADENGYPSSAATP